jgi:hypothetical protein
MDRTLSQLSDFANYCGDARTFVPRRLVETFMSVEQLGRRIQGVLVHERDMATRRALGFDAFDTMKGLGIMPSPAAELLLLPARRAVQALREMQTGFFLPSRTTGAIVRLPDRHGREREWPIEEAVALYLQLARNANHGFTPERDANERRDQILLMAHDGDIPGDVSF